MEGDQLLKKYDGRYYLRNGRQTLFSLKDSQSFTLTRFLVPELCGFRGEALVVDPDVFFVGQATELQNLSLGNDAILCRKKTDVLGVRSFASSVMFLNCEKLKHWGFNLIEKLFSMELDYYDLMWLKNEDQGSIREIDARWNDIDELTDNTVMIHYSYRKTQPWMKGVRFDDFIPRHKADDAIRNIAWEIKHTLRSARKMIVPEFYCQNSSPQQEKLFFKLASQAIQKDPSLSRELKDIVNRRQLRGDFFECLDA